MSDLHSKIMNLQVKPCQCRRMVAYTHYCHGHRDARHAAAELASAHVAKLECERNELLAALKDIARGKLQEPQPFEQYAVGVAKRAIAKVESEK